MQTGQNFYKGDIVVCIDSTITGGMLTDGNIYRVIEKMNFGGLEGPYLKVENMSNTAEKTIWHNTRFELVEAASVMVMDQEYDAIIQAAEAYQDVAGTAFPQR